MKNVTGSLRVGMVALLLLGAGIGHAQQTEETVIGPPQLKDFSLQPRETIVPAPDEAPARTEPRGALPVIAPPPPPATSRAAPPPARREAPAERAAAPAETPSVSPAPAPVPAPADQPDAPVPSAGPPVTSLPEADLAPAPAPVSTPSEDAGRGLPTWMLALPALMLFGLAFLLMRRRRLAAAAPIDMPEPAPEPAPQPAAHPTPDPAAQPVPKPSVAAPAARTATLPRPDPVPAAPAVQPRPDPIPRPWLELAIKAERASFTNEEAEVQFELEISNQGEIAARNLRIDVKLFNAGAQQDQEIGAFFSTAGRETTKLNLPVVEAGVVGVIRGTVGIKREEMRAVQLDERLIFIPVLAVNALYDWGEGRSGQTSKSYLIGRELQQPSEKMGAFRVDQGPRIWRTVGQRPHNLAKKL